MAKTYGIGRPGMTVAVAAAAVMFIISFLVPAPFSISGNFGICLPSPDLWNINPVASWILNIALAAACTIGTWLLNRSFNFIRSTQPVLQALFLIMVAANPWITGELSSSLLLCLINIIGLALMFRDYSSPNATQDLFAIGTFLGIGSMFQYGFIPMMPAYVLMAVAMKNLRIKEFIAFLLGIAAPFWVSIGLGIIPLENFQLPEIVPLFINYDNALEIFLLVASTGIAIFLGVMTGLFDSVRLYAGNSRVNAMNVCVSILGIFSIVCVVVDFNNMLVYLATLYFTVAVQLANVCALWNMKHQWLVTAIPALIFIGFFVAMTAV